MLTLGENVSDGLYLAYCPLLAFLLEGADVPLITIKLLCKKHKCPWLKLHNIASLVATLLAAEAVVVASSVL